MCDRDGYDSYRHVNILFLLPSVRLNYSAEPGVNQHICDSYLLLELGKLIISYWTEVGKYMNVS